MMYGCIGECMHTHARACTYFYSHFADEPGLAICLSSFSFFICFETETLGLPMWVCFTGQMPFLSSNPTAKSTEEQVSAIADGPRDAGLCALDFATDGMCDVACYDERSDSYA